MSMCESFLKLSRGSRTTWLMGKYPWAYLLLNLIALRACRSLPNSDGLEIGEAHIGDWDAIGATRGQYRHALKILEKERAIKILETNRNRKKATTGTTTEGTKVKLLNLDIWDINPETNNHRNNHFATTEQPLNNHEEEEKKIRIKEDHPSIPSGRSDRMTDDFSSKYKIEICQGVFLTQEEIDSCIQIKGDVEKVKRAIEFIQSSKKRRHDISDWPNALATWKIDNKAKVRIQHHLALAEKLCKAFDNYEDGHGWRCYLYNDQKRDQRGLLFECQSPYKEAIFIALADGEFKQKCEEAMKKNKMTLIA